MSEENLERPEEKVEEEALNPEDLMSMWESALKEAQNEKASSEEPLIPPPEPKEREVFSSQPAQLQELKPQKEEGLHPEFDFILDIPLEISVEIGRTRMLIKELLKLNQGSIVELEKFAGEPVEVYVNGKLMAKGEVVVVNDRFGVRITEIISAQDRIKKLGS